MSQPERKISAARGCTRQCCFTITFRMSFILFFLAYVSVGAYIFLALESTGDTSPPTEEVRAADVAGDQLQLQEMMTHQLLERLWDITESLNILYKENWTQLASNEMAKVHGAILQLDKKNDCHNHREPSSTTTVGPRVQWNYPMAFLYSLSVITTLGNLDLIQRKPGTCKCLLQVKLDAVAVVIAANRCYPEPSFLPMFKLPQKFVFFILMYFFESRSMQSI